MGELREQDFCYFCRKLIKSNLYEAGYGGGSYDHQTHYPYERRMFKYPEGSIAVDTCVDCLDKPVSQWIHQLRLEKLQKEINAAPNIRERLLSKQQYYNDLLQELGERHTLLNKYHQQVKNNEEPSESWDEVKLNNKLRMA